MSVIAVIGLGNMGAPMAGNLVKAGHEVRGYDLSPTARQAAEAAGLSVGEAVEDAVRGAEVVLTMLPTGKHVLQAWGQILPLARPGALFIDSSTIDVESARRAHRLAADWNVMALDAPVSGGVPGACEARLTFMVGGKGEAFVRGRPILEAMGKRIVRCGDGGAGQAAKICNNMIAGVSMIAVSEAFALAERLGITPQALFEVASTSSGQCWAMTAYCPVPGLVPQSPANNGYQAGFAADLMLKDLRLAQQAALETGATTPLGAVAAQIYSLFAGAGNGGDDFSAVIRLFQDQEGDPTFTGA